jgi:DNA-binding response OmpR family regulator
MSLELIQIIEDEPAHAGLLDHYLRQARFRTNIAFDGETGLQDATRMLPSVILLDVMLPRMSGHEVCREVRRTPSLQCIPLIMISALGEEQDRLAGLDLGADDYITKPFSPREVVSRVHALLRRSRRQNVLPSGDPGSPVVVQEQVYVAAFEKKQLTLSGPEVTILRRLASHPGRVVAQEELEGLVWGDPSALHERELDALLRGLRRKLENNYVGSIEILADIGCRFLRARGAMP